MYAYLPYGVAFGVGHVKATCRVSAGLRKLETSYFLDFGRVERFDAANLSSFGRLGRPEGSGLEGRMGSERGGERERGRERERRKRWNEREGER